MKTPTSFILLATLILSSSLTPAAPHLNITSEGSAIIGVHDGGNLSTLGTPFERPDQAGATPTARLTDNDLSTYMDTFNGSATTTHSYLGILWQTPRADAVQFITIDFATFFDGGWFGNNNAGPGSGNALVNPTHVSNGTTPIVQVTTDGGTTWSDVAASNNYLSRMTGHTIGGGANPNPNTIKVTYTLNTAVTGINGIRLIGREGGTASNGFVGAMEIDVFSINTQNTGGGLDSPEPMNPFFNNVFPSATPGGDGEATFTRVFQGLPFVQPTFLTTVPGQNKFLVIGKQGRIHTFDNNEATATLDLMLDINAIDNIGNVFTSTDSGATSLVFHPNWPNTNQVFISYKWRPSNAPAGTDPNHAFWRLSRFTVNPNTLVADPSSEFILIQQFDRHDWHDGGHLAFGNDGFLYFTNGDEGLANDPFDVSQKINDRLFGGVFRIDVDNDSSRSHAIPRQPRQLPYDPVTTSPEPNETNRWSGTHDSFTQGYMIPNDNPFVGQSNVLEEFYALGLRSPFRMYKDPDTGTFYVGDVGQAAREELNLITSGANYQWPFREGTLNGPDPIPNNLIGTSTPPIWEYGRNLGVCIVAGQIYQGAAIPGLANKHIVCDHGLNRFWALTVSSGTVTNTQELFVTPGGGTNQGPSCIAQGPDGELYYMRVGINEGASMFKIIPVPGTINPEPPGTLSATGLFTDLANLTPATGLFPYTPNSPLWSDFSDKPRWIALPNGGDGIHFGPDETIGFSPNGNWDFPTGTVLVKHFQLALDENNPNDYTKLETRVMVVLEDDTVYGVTYRWREDQTDADLLLNGESEDYTIQLAGGGTTTQRWDFPSRANCLQCHTPQAGYVLGPRTHQLNADQFYPRTGRTANQLDTFYKLGWFNDAYNPLHLPFFLKSYDLDDTSAPLQDRVRSYLDSNCSHCHQPGGVRAFFDARFTTPLHNQNLIHGEQFGSFIGAGEAVVKPGNVSLSSSHFRMNRVGANQMPPIGRNEIDTLAVQRITEWINSLEARPGVRLSAPETVFSSLVVSVVFTENVTGLEASDFVVQNGTVTSLNAISPSNYELTITTASSGNTMVYLPENRAISGTSLGNFPSNLTSTEIVQNGLVTSYSFEETAGSIAVDESSTGNDGTLVNMAASPWINGQCDQAISLDGSNDSITLDNVAPNSFTVGMWVRTTSTFPATPTGTFPTQWLLWSNAGGVRDDWGIALAQNNGVNTIRFFTGVRFFGNFYLNATSPINTGEWVHVAVTRSQTTGVMTVYINGVNEGSRTVSTNTLDDNPNIILGSDGTSSFFNGDIDEFRIYNRVLTPQEVQDLQNCTQPGSPYIQWAQTNLPGLTHIQDPDADPENDGLTNFLERAFGLNPLAFDSEPVVTGINSNNRLTLSFPRYEAGQPGRPEYDIYVSEDLITWVPAGDDLNQTNVQDIAGPTEMVTYEYTGTLGTQGKLFGKVRVRE